jgi:hypothetical protein
MAEDLDATRTTRGKDLRAPERMIKNDCYMSKENLREIDWINRSFMLSHARVVRFILRK